MHNEEGYPDPTPGEALGNIRREEIERLDAEDAARMKKALKEAKSILKAAGFVAIERIVVKNIRTGRIYR